MKFTTRNLVIRCVAWAFVSCCAGCSGPSNEVAVNSTGNAVQSNFDPVASFLSDQPQAVLHGNRMQINADVSAAYPDAAMLYLFSALKRNPQVTRIKIVWGWHIADHATNRMATYSRNTKMLWYRENNFGYGEKPQYKFYIYKGVTSQMLYQAAEQSINSGGGNAFSNLDKQGCQLLTHRQGKSS